MDQSLASGLQGCFGLGLFSDSGEKYRKWPGVEQSPGWDLQPQPAVGPSGPGVSSGGLRSSCLRTGARAGDVAVSEGGLS